MSSNRAVNDPISHCRHGQGGRTLKRSKPGSKRRPDPTISGIPAHRLSQGRRKSRRDVRPIPGGIRFPHGKYQPMGDA